MKRGRPKKQRNEAGEITRPDGELVRDLIALAYYVEARIAGKGRAGALRSASSKMIGRFPGARVGVETVAAIVRRWDCIGTISVAISNGVVTLTAGPRPEFEALPAFGGRDLELAGKSGSNH